MKKNILIGVVLCTGAILTARASDGPSETNNRPWVRGILTEEMETRSEGPTRSFPGRAIFVLDDLSIIKVEPNGLTYVSATGFAIGSCRRSIVLSADHNAIVRWEMSHTQMLHAIERYKEVIFADYR